MIIGIDASRAFEKKRTGIEEYSFQVLKRLAQELKTEQVVLYVRNSEKNELGELPDGWRIKKIKWPFLWTQLGLSLEMLANPVEVLFVPAHVVPAIHPARNATLFNLGLFIQKILRIIRISTFYNKHNVAGGPQKTVVTIHGLEYEFFPEGYSFWERLYMRWSIKASCRWAKKIIAVSENTKKDLIRLYQVPEEKIEVVPEGASENFQFPISNDKISKPYLLFIGRLEERKNIGGIIRAFEILKEKNNLPHQLILAGKPGYGYRDIKDRISNSKYRGHIIEKGFVSEEEKRKLLQDAELFLFPSFYEGFGLPILEAQSAGVPVVTSSVSSMPEVAGAGALFADPKDPEKIAQAISRLVSEKDLKDDIIKKGLENIRRFHWSDCGRKIAKLLVE